MKRKLLYFTSIVLFSVISLNAQTTIWDFGNSSSMVNGGTTISSWAINSGIGTSEIVKDKLGLYPISTNTNFGAVNASNATFTDGYVGANRFQMNGGGGVTAPNYSPVQRYLYFNVDGPCVVKVWFKAGSNGSTRTIYVTDGTNLIGSAATNNGTNTDTAIVTANYTNIGGGKLYIYGDSANNLYKVEVTGANVTTPSLGIDDFHADAASNVYSNGKLVFVSNVKSDTQVDVYGISGALVKSFKTGADTSFDLNTGLYVVRSKSAEGEITAKVLVN